MDWSLLVIFSFLFLQIILVERLDMFSIVSFWNWYGRHLPQKKRGSYPFHLVIPAFLCPSTNLHTKILDSIHEIPIREMNYHWNKQWYHCREWQSFKCIWILCDYICPKNYIMFFNYFFFFLPMHYITPYNLTQKTKLSRF